MFPHFPVIHFSAESNAAPDGKPGIGAKKGDDKGGDKGFSCAIYKYPSRTDKYFIVKINLKCDSGQGNVSRAMQPAMNWRLKGCALMCSRD